MRILPARLVPLCCLVVLAGTACGGSDDPATTDSESSTSTSAESSPEPEPAEETADPSADFCTTITDVRSRLEVLNLSLATDWATTIPAIRQGESELQAIEPPSELAADLADVTAFFTLITDAFDGVDPGDEAAVQTVLESVFGPETEASATTAAAAVERIDAYVAENCSDGPTDAPASAVDDGCALLDEDELRSRVFVKTEPTATPRSYGDGYDECIWTDDRSEVSLMLIPLDEFEREYVAKSTPITNSPIDGVEGGLAYKGTLGIGRFNTRGHSVSFVAGDRGGFVSVRIGEDGSQAADVGEAGRLASLLLAGL
jgi:hypothetical protein